MGVWSHTWDNHDKQKLCYVKYELLLLKAACKASSHLFDRAMAEQLVITLQLKKVFIWNVTQSWQLG